MPAKTLTEAEFKQKRPKGSYSKYLNYVGKRRAAQDSKAPPGQKQAPYDPLAPTPPPKLRQQASSIVNKGVEPVLANLETTYGARADAGSRAIEHYTGSLADHLRGLTELTDAAYGRAQTEAAAAQQAGVAELQQLGGELGAGLRDQLAGLGLGAGVEALADRPAAVGIGSGGALGALAGASAARLAGEGAAQRTLAGTFDRTAAVGGLQSIRALQAQLNQQRTEERGAITAQVPGAIENTYQGLADREFQKAVAVQGGLTDVAKIQADVASDTADREQRAEETRVADENRDADRASREAIAQANREAQAAREKAKNEKKGSYTPQQKQAAFRGAQTAGLSLAKTLLKPKTRREQQPEYVLNPDGSKRLDDNGQPIPTGNTVTVTVTDPPPPFGDTVEQVFGILAQRLEPYGYSSLQIRKIARQIVVSAGGVPAVQRG